MAHQSQLDETYMICAEAHSVLSDSERTKVGACLVTPAGIVIAGYNGLAAGGDNELEYVDYTDDSVVNDTEYPFYDHATEKFYRLVTKPEVIHAELNCVLKAAEEGVSVRGCTIYVTLSPCLTCAEMLCQLKIKRVVYKDAYRCSKGLDRLLKGGIVVEQIEMTRTLS